MSEERRFSESHLCAFITGEGTPAERRAIQEAIASSPELRRTYDSLLKTWSLLDGYRIPEPPAGGLEDFHRRLKVRSIPERKPVTTGLLRPWQAAAVAASVLLAIGIPAFILSRGGPGTMPGIIPVLTPVPPVAAATPIDWPPSPEFASVPARSGPSRRFLAGRDGNLQAGVTVNVDSLAEWDHPVLRVEHMEDLPTLNLEDYAITNYEFEGGYHLSPQPEVVPVSTDPM